MSEEMKNESQQPAQPKMNLREIVQKSLSQPTSEGKLENSGDKNISSSDTAGNKSNELTGQGNQQKTPKKEEGKEIPLDDEIYKKLDINKVINPKTGRLIIQDIMELQRKLKKYRRQKNHLQ